ncbi:unnamed protein product [Leuciscus chuanchicus]
MDLCLKEKIPFLSRMIRAPCCSQIPILHLSGTRFLWRESPSNAWRGPESQEAGCYGPLLREEDGTLWPLTGFHYLLRATLLTWPRRRMSESTLPPVANSGHARVVLHESLHGYLIRGKVTEVQQESSVVFLQ